MKVSTYRVTVFLRRISPPERHLALQVIQEVLSRFSPPPMSNACPLKPHANCSVLVYTVSIVSSCHCHFHSCENGHGHGHRGRDHDPRALGFPLG